MAVRKIKPATPGQRNKIISAFDTITGTKPEKSLLHPVKKSGGRNVSGRRTMRYIGGGHKRMYRVIDFLRDKDGLNATVRSIEYDPNRSARIALVVYEDGDKRYIVAPAGLQVGHKIVSGKDATPEVGNTMFLSTSLSVQLYIILSSNPERVLLWQEVPGHMPRFQPVRENML